MIWLIAKYVLTSAVVVAVSEFAKRSVRLGGLLAVLPMFLAFPWLPPRMDFWPTLAAPLHSAFVITRRR